MIRAPLGVSEWQRPKIVNLSKPFAGSRAAAQAALAYSRRTSACWEAVKFTCPVPV